MGSVPCSPQKPLASESPGCPSSPTDGTSCIWRPPESPSSLPGPAFRGSWRTSDRARCAACDCKVSAVPAGPPRRPPLRMRAGQDGSNVSFPHLFGHVLGGSHGERQDRQRRILRAAGYERAAIHNEEILHIVTLVIFIEHRYLRIGAHATGSQLV